MESLGTWTSFGTSFYPKGNSLHILCDKALLYFWLIMAVKGKTEPLNAFSFITEWMCVQCYPWQLVEIFLFITFQPLLFILRNKNKFKVHTILHAQTFKDIICLSLRVSFFRLTSQFSHILCGTHPSPSQLALIVFLQKVLAEIFIAVILIANRPIKKCHQDHDLVPKSLILPYWF